MARGASWDVDLEERIGDAIGVEARAQGANFFAGVCINLLRHPAWGRAQETYGEDPYHLGEMGAALVRGVQRHVMACAKHYACNSIEDTRFKVDVRISERALREVYLPHFKRCVDEGVAAVMSAYNQVNGDYCGHNRHLLRDILKDEWGFQGFVMSDFCLGAARRQGRGAGRPGRGDARRTVLRQEARQAGREQERCRTPLWTRRCCAFFAARSSFAPGRRAGALPEAGGRRRAHRALARESAQKSMVLLKNEPVGNHGGSPLLPLDPARLRRIALIGRLAAEPNTGDLRGSSTVRPPHVVTPLEGLRAALGPAARSTPATAELLRRAAEAVRGAEVAVVVAGLHQRRRGRDIQLPGQMVRGDRVRLTLSPQDEALIRAVAAANPRTVVVLMGGSALITEAWRGLVPAILMAWYPGMEGGHALADILLGKANPSGKLPCAFPRSEASFRFSIRRPARSSTATSTATG